MIIVSLFLLFVSAQCRPGNIQGGPVEGQDLEHPRTLFSMEDRIREANTKDILKKIAEVNINHGLAARNMPSRRYKEEKSKQMNYGNAQMFSNPILDYLQRDTNSGLRKNEEKEEDTEEVPSGHYIKRKITHKQTYIIPSQPNGYPFDPQMGQEFPFPNPPYDAVEPDKPEENKTTNPDQIEMTQAKQQFLINNIKSIVSNSQFPQPFSNVYNPYMPYYQPQYINPYQPNPYAFRNTPIGPQLQANPFTDTYFANLQTMKNGERNLGDRIRNNPAKFSEGDRYFNRESNPPQEIQYVRLPDIKRPDHSRQFNWPLSNYFPLTIKDPVQTVYTAVTSLVEYGQKDCKKSRDVAVRSAKGISFDEFDIELLKFLEDVMKQVEKEDEEEEGTTEEPEESTTEGPVETSRFLGNPLGDDKLVAKSRDVGLENVVGMDKEDKNSGITSEKSDFNTEQTVQNYEKIGVNPNMDTDLENAQMILEKGLENMEKIAAIPNQETDLGNTQMILEKGLENTENIVVEPSRDVGMENGGKLFGKLAENAQKNYMPLENPNKNFESNLKNMENFPRKDFFLDNQQTTTEIRSTKQAILGSSSLEKELENSKKSTMEDLEMDDKTQTSPSNSPISKPRQKRQASLESTEKGRRLIKILESIREEEAKNGPKGIIKYLERVINETSPMQTPEMELEGIEILDDGSKRSKQLTKQKTQFAKIQEDKFFDKTSSGSGIFINRLKVRKGGVAIAGPGGIATAGSGGTAIVGPNGVAYTQPNGVAIAGPGSRVIAVDPGIDLNKFVMNLTRYDGSTPRIGKVVAIGPVVYYNNGE